MTDESSPTIHRYRTANIRKIPTDQCLFCKGSLKGVGSNEHIIPQWLQGELGIKKDLLMPTHFESVDSVKIISQRRHTVDNLVEGRVCEPCNVGWMANLENLALPILKTLIHGQRDIKTLRPEETAIVARWTIKTACMLNSGSNYSALIPELHFSDIYRAQMPEGVAVYTQQLPAFTKPFFWIQGSIWQLRHLGRSSDYLKSMSAKSYKILFRFGRLILMVAYWPEKNWTQARWRGVHLILWPRVGGAYERDINDFPWGDETSAPGAFLGSLFLIENS